MADVKETRPERVGEPRDQRPLPRLAQVAGQQEPARPLAHEKHRRRLVGGPPVVQGVDRHPLGGRVEHVDRHGSLSQPLSGAERHRARRIAVRGRQELEPCRTVVDRHRARQAHHLHPADDARRPADVIEIGVGDDHPFQARHAAPPEVREDDAPAGVAKGVRRPGVDQPRRPVGEMADDGVALADIEPGDLPPPVRPDRRRQEDGHTERRRCERVPGPAPPDSEGGRHDPDRSDRPAGLSRHPHRCPAATRHHDRLEAGQHRPRRPAQGARQRLDPRAVGEERHPERGKGQARQGHGERVDGQAGGSNPAKRRGLDRHRPEGRGGRREETADQDPPEPSSPGG
jgi:hypothetical protein